MISYLYLCIAYIKTSSLYTFITWARCLHQVRTSSKSSNISWSSKHLLSLLHCFVSVLLRFYCIVFILFKYVYCIQSSITITGTITSSTILTCITPLPISLTLCILVCHSSNIVSKHFVTSLICSTPVNSNLIMWLTTIQFCEQCHALIYARE